MAGSERRKSPRSNYVLRDGELYYKGRRLPLPQTAIRAALLDRIERGLWIPDYTSLGPIRVGDDIAHELLGKEPSRRNLPGIA